VRESGACEVACVVRESGIKDTWGSSAAGPRKPAGVALLQSLRRYVTVDDGAVSIGSAEMKAG